jgi:hypothetical protein
VFQNDELKDHLETSFSVESESAVVAEWNMNVPGNILKIGNYRYRENSSQYSVIPNLFDINDDGNFYTGATNADVTVAVGFEDQEFTPQLFTYPKDKEKQLYSLEECLKPFRPRSGINKLSYFSGKYLPFSNKDMYLRPRYYMPTKDDEFKYWRSYRTESNTEIPFASIISNYAIVSNVRGSSGNWQVTISNLSSILELPIGKVFAASSNTALTLYATTGTPLATVGAITGTGPWTATITGLTSTSGLFVGDRLTATSGTGTGSLFGGEPTQIVVTSIVSPTSISYSVTGGTTPTAGTINNVKTVPGFLGTAKMTVTSHVNSSTITASIVGPDSVDDTGEPIPVSYGSIKNVYVNKFNINVEYGISKNSNNDRYIIEDCNPFVAYKEPVPANRIVLKVQTNIGSINLGPFKTSGSSQLNDPFFGEQNKTVPSRFKVQYLSSSDQWLDAYEFNESTLRDDGVSPVFGPDGHLSLEYGIEIPQDYRNNFTYLGELQSEALLPQQNFIGNAYLILSQANSKGRLKIWNGFEYDDLTPVYRWFIGTDNTYENTHFVTDFTNPSFYNETGDGENTYREFVWVKGLRVVVQTMSVPGTPLELIEISPRLVANLSENLIDFNVTKAASDLSGSALPVGQVMAGVGNITLFDEDNSFNPNNEWDFEESTGSIIAKHINKNIKFVFYEVIKKVNDDNYYVPIKTMYSETFPERDARTGETSLSLRDFYFHFEALKSPRILITEASLSQAVCLLLDAVGFSNYVFKRLPTESDPVIPYFFIPPDESIAETLSNLARATQSAMFFDEFNNFVVMTKSYLLDESVERIPDVTLYGSDLIVDGKIEKPANIIAIESKDRKVYNAGTINYTTRYIQRTGGTIAQSRFVDKDYVYLPSLLWEVSGSETTKSSNDAKQERFALSAVPLNVTLSSEVPSVSVDGVIINNTFDIGENAYWLTRNQGFFYSNSEIIRYDAVEYNVTGTGNVWISSNLEYQRYFSEIPFNGKMYPTGLIRIYAEPFFETVSGIAITENNQEITESVRLKTGAVVAHGRGQFGTPIVTHNAGLDSYWSDNNNVQGCEMDSSLLYTTDLVANRRTPVTRNTGPAGLSKTISEKTQRNGIIKNYLSSGFKNETDIVKLKTTESSTIQSSALVMTGPDFQPADSPRNFVSYVHKKLNGAYKHFGTRVRIIGRVEPLAPRSQSVVGGMTYFSVTSENPADTVAIGGGSAGINLVNPETNIGYYFEIAALTSTNLESFLKKEESSDDATVSIENILFYKIEKDANTGVLAGGTPTSVEITAIDSPTSISYRVTNGSTPVAGTLSNARRVSGSPIVFSETATVQDITSPEGFSNIWDARLTGITSTSALSVGDIIAADAGTATKGVPIRLWGGIGNIIVDDGNFTGQNRFTGEENPTVYDLAIEYVDVNESRRDFYLYINQVLVQRIVDNNPIPLVNQSLGLFVRGNSKAMFENVYALSKNYATNTVFDVNTPIASVFGDADNQVDASEALKKYAMSGVIQNTYLSGVKPNNVPDYSLYFEEFGSIFRECAYFNIKYDRAYPALFAKIAPTFNSVKGYTVSGFAADSYGAEFLVFNNTDTILNLDEKTGNYLRILGIAFTQNTTNSLTVDDYLKRRGNLSDPELKGSDVIQSPFRAIEQYEKVKQSRILYGKNDFTLDSLYIQDQDTAEDILGWIIEKNIRPRKSVGLKIFSMPILQLGDLVNINYKDSEGIDLVSPISTKYVVYNINYAKSLSGPEMTVYLSEV